MSTRFNDEVIKRATGLLVLEVKNSNPNGDPDQESDPRQRQTDERGVISPVSLKRKVRDLIAEKDGPVWKAVSESLALNGNEFKYEILESRGRDRNAIRGLQAAEFIKTYWDARVFGNTFLETMNREEPGDGDKSHLLRSGVLQVGMGISVAPIVIERMTNTNKSGVQEGKDRGMAPLAYRVVQHGVYCMPFFVNPTAAVKTGCQKKDVELFLRVLPHAYSHTASYLRPFVEVRHAWYVEHKSVLGSCPDSLILDSLSPRRIGDPDTPSNSWSDYEDPSALSEGLKARLDSVRDLVAEL